MHQFAILSKWISLWTAALLTLPGFASAVIVPFTEDFLTDDAGWQTQVSGTPTYMATGGPAGSESFISGSFTFAATAGDGVTVIRGQGSNNASGDAFVGNWIDGSVTEFSAQVRHDAPVPLSVFTRIAGPANFPGALGLDFVPVLPNTWTEISFPVGPTSPNILYVEGGNFNSIFSNVSNVQIGVTTPDGLENGQYTFDVASVSIVPEPSASLSALLGLSIFVLHRRRPSTPKLSSHSAL